ncbi:protein FAM184A-like isoform X2 [Ostrea edulis]|uniref:protein FAM184A-like isoform X2 n=1 Tax=Ostrea edulis TaxID=37623 RepID=UPI002094F957|nr:protein FAM184A-like isoform X2 [Ostrea edulis]XP_056022550.1 protein FAM184A-like isoform X2 [Ostrea edulis]
MTMTSEKEKAKKTFDFRMSKKVAELTQVVHMLFTRNHEKEVEIEALKEAYEYEISLVHEDATEQLGKIEEKRKELEKLLEKERKAGRERVKSAVQQEASTKEEQWKEKVKALEQQLADEKNESQNLRDLLINAQKDIEKLRQGVAEQLQSKNEEIHRKNQELERLRQKVANLEHTQSENEKHYKEIIRDLEKSNEKLERELAQLQALLEETHRSKMHFESKSQKLETDLKNLKKDFSKKVSEVVASQRAQQASHHLPAQRQYTPTGTMTIKDYNEEVEKLRREVQRYRMELSNRDNNFNRMFTDGQQLMVDPRAGKIAITQQQVLAAGPTQSKSDPLLTNREKSFSYAFVQSLDESVSTDGVRVAKRPPSSRVSSASGRLPALTQEQKTRLTKLMKPRPLPKEMLYGK